MNKDLSHLKVGDNVFVASFLGSWGGPQYTKGVVQKITPAGMIDVLIGHGKEPTRFNPDGRSRGKYSREQIDAVMTFEEREADLETELRAAAANSALQLVTCEKMRNPDKDTLVTEAARLQNLLLTAIALIGQV